MKSKAEKAEYLRQYYIENKERLAAYQKQYRNKNKETLQERSKNYYLNNMDRVKKRAKNFYAENKREIIDRQIKLAKIKRRSNPQVWLAESMRAKINYLIKVEKARSNNLGLKFLGCDLNTFKNHISKQFKDGMTWENHGFYGWHIDHKIPYCAFDLTKKSDREKCFHYSNLQPLWAKENLEKQGSWR